MVGIKNAIFFLAFEFLLQINSNVNTGPPMPQSHFMLQNIISKMSRIFKITFEVFSIIKHIKKHNNSVNNMLNPLKRITPSLENAIEKGICDKIAKNNKRPKYFFLECV